MRKLDKQLRRVKPQHKPEKPPAEMLPVKKTKKPEPRYRAEHYWKGFSKGGGGWWRTGSDKSLDQAIHIAKKHNRSWFCGTEAVRVVDTVTGLVVWSHNCTGTEKP